MSSSPTTGVLFLDDLFGHHGSTALRAESWRDPGPEWLPPSVLPPAALVVVSRSLQMSELRRLVPWLSLAERVGLVFDERQEPTLAVDAELQEVARLEREELAASLGNIVWVSGTRRSVHTAIEEAVAAVGRAAPPARVVPTESRRAATPGPWIHVNLGAWKTEHDLPGILRRLRGAITLGDSITLLERARGLAIDLETGDPSAAHPELASEAIDVIALPGARSWVSLEPRKPRQHRPATVRIRGIEGSEPTPVWGQPMGCSPDGRIVWGGLRCVVQWSVRAGGRVRPWTTGRIRWPDTHAKKLFGHLDNIGLWVDLAPDASACLSVMEYDTLLTPGLPVRWHRTEELCVARGVTDHPLRALFFQYTGLYDVPEEECVGAGEEVRGRRATMSLGPNADRRYVVGFDANTWRVLGERCERIGVAGGGYAIFDSQHRVTGWSPERMWAGWDRWVLLETFDGVFERLDLISDEREPLVAMDRELQACVAVPGSPNFLLVARDGDGVAIRLV